MELDQLHVRKNNQDVGLLGDVGFGILDTMEPGDMVLFYIPVPNPKCLRCGYEWVARRGEPVACPGCKSRKWRTERVKTVRKFKRGEGVGDTMTEETESTPLRLAKLMKLREQSEQAQAQWKEWE